MQFRRGSEAAPPEIESAVPGPSWFVLADQSTDRRLPGSKTAFDGSVKQRCPPNRIKRQAIT